MKVFTALLAEISVKMLIYYQKARKKSFSWKSIYTVIVCSTLWLYYTAVLYNADSHYNAVSAWFPNIFPVYVSKYQETIMVYTMQAVKIVLPVYFLAKFEAS